MDTFPDYKEILRLTFEEKLSAGKIAKKTGIGKTTILEFLRRYRNSKLSSCPLNELTLSNEDIRRALYKPQVLFQPLEQNDTSDANNEDNNADNSAKSTDSPTSEDKEAQIPLSEHEELVPADTKTTEEDDFNISDIKEAENDEEGNKEKYDFSKKKATLCWDCAKATGFCDWSRMLEPVPGWTAFVCTQKEGKTYKVVKCPEFVPDACHSGMIRINTKPVALLEEGVKKDA